MKTAKQIGELSLAEARRAVAHLQWCLALAERNRSRAERVGVAEAQADLDAADAISTEVARAEGRRMAELARAADRRRHRRQTGAIG
jgi:hypothetical protein